MNNIREYLDRNLKKINFIRKINYNLKSDYKIFKKFLLNKESLFVDLGANKGDVTQFIKDEFDCFTESYEPDKYTYKKLFKRFKNSKKNKTYNLGISKKNLKEKIYYHKKFILNNFIYSQSSSFVRNKLNIDINNFKIVKTLPIKKLLKRYEHIDLLKIDIEGYEYEILDDIIKNKDKITYVLCELHGKPSKLTEKNKGKKNPFSLKYKRFKKKLRKKKLLNTWFFEWY